MGSTSDRSARVSGPVHRAEPGPAVVVQLDADGRVRWVSDAAASLLGWAPADVLGQLFADHVEPDDRPILSGGDSLRSAAPATVRVRRADGGLRQMDVRLISSDAVAAAGGHGEIILILRVSEPGEVVVLGEEALRTELRHWEDRARQLQAALESRVVIEQAKGVLAGERGITVDDAFALLRDHARRRGLRLHEVATAVVSLGLRP